MKRERVLWSFSNLYHDRLRYFPPDLYFPDRLRDELDTVMVPFDSNTTDTFCYLVVHETSLFQACLYVHAIPPTTGDPTGDERCRRSGTGLDSFPHPGRRSRRGGRMKGTSH